MAADRPSRVRVPYAVMTSQRRKPAPFGRSLRRWRRVPAAMADVAVAEPHGVRQQPIADHAAVDEQELAVRLRARCRGQPDPAFDREARLGMGHEA